jgi:hypothetical protein
VITRASIEFIAPRFRAGLITPIFTPADAAEMAELADQHHCERGEAVA